MEGVMSPPAGRERRKETSLAECQISHLFHFPFSTHFHFFINSDVFVVWGCWVLFKVFLPLKDLYAFTFLNSGTNFVFTHINILWLSKIIYFLYCK